MTIVHKIGGSCLHSLKNLQNVKKVVSTTPCILVVSATYGTTQDLLSCLELSAKRHEYATKVRQIILKHLKLNLNTSNDRSIEASLKKDQEDILALLQSVSILGLYSQEQKDWLLGYGEYWSSKIVAALLKAQWIDAGNIITVNYHENLAHIEWAETTLRFEKIYKAKPQGIIVMPGFVARNTQGQRALLGFNGSDYSASIIAKLAKAEQFIKWTDIDGIYTADPNLVKSAFAIPELSYQEAAELAYFGAFVLHPQSVSPLIDAKIPIFIKNFYKPMREGTKISQTPSNRKYIIKGLSSIKGVSLINLEGTGLLGFCGAAGRLFSTLARAEVSVILISQASSEHSICIVVNTEQSQRAMDCIRMEFNFELGHNLIQKIQLTSDCTIITAVGDGMNGTPGVAAKFLQMLARVGINILAIAQGSSERSISAVIRDELTQKALGALHGGFYLSSKTLSIGLIGPGGVGSTLLEQIKSIRNHLKQQLFVDLQVRGIMNSNSMLISETPIEKMDWQKQLKKKERSRDLQQFIAHIASEEIPHSVIIDCTSSADIAEHYPMMMEKGCHIVTPNKKANSSPLNVYKNIKQCSRKNNKQYLYEATVCAGLPVIKTIQELMATGDVIKRIEGIVSGTLSYIFHQCALGKSFSESVLEAYQLGYTEPDPRDDLNGLDVARKFVCLGRELGYDTVLEEVEQLNLVPDSLKNCSVEAFLENLPAHAGPIENHIQQLLKKYATIAYAGCIDKGKISISLNGYSSKHPFANTKGTDNILLIQSKRYDKQTLIIQGPGAGRDVTAAGVFADLLKLATML